MSQNFVLFFGCNEQAGHHLIGPSGYSVRDFEADRLMVPHDHQLDGSCIFLPRPEVAGNGAVTYLPATDWTILAWWGSPFDKRGAVNNAIIVSGKVRAEECWRLFAAAFPTLASKLMMPRIVAESTI